MVEGVERVKRRYSELVLAAPVNRAGFTTDLVTH
jgi:hypothetical protein